LGGGGRDAKRKKTKKVEHPQKLASRGAMCKPKGPAGKFRGEKKKNPKPSQPQEVPERPQNQAETGKGKLQRGKNYKVQSKSPPTQDNRRDRGDRLGPPTRQHKLV